MTAGEINGLLVGGPFEKGTNMREIVTTLAALNATCANMLLVLDRLQNKVHELEQRLPSKSHEERLREILGTSGSIGQS